MSGALPDNGSSAAGEDEGTQGTRRQGRSLVQCPVELEPAMGAVRSTGARPQHASATRPRKTPPALRPMPVLRPPGAV